MQLKGSFIELNDFFIMLFVVLNMSKFGLSHSSFELKYDETN